MNNKELDKNRETIQSKGYKVRKGGVSGFSIEVEEKPYVITSYTYYDNEETRDEDFKLLTNMKRILTILLGVTLLSSCSVHTSDNVDVDAEDIQYVKDEKTGLCFGVVASRKSFQTDATGLGVTCVPCEKVEKYLKK